MKFFDPRAKPTAYQQRYHCRLNDMGCPTLGLFSNLFNGATRFLENLADEIAELCPRARFCTFDKGHIRNASFPAPDELINKIRLMCSGVVLAYGHCGSCTAGTVRDAVRLAKLGIPVAILVTEKFVCEARFLSRATGLPEVPIVTLPHPIAGRTDEFQKTTAHALAPAVLAALVTGVSRPNVVNDGALFEGVGNVRDA